MVSWTATATKASCLFGKLLIHLFPKTFLWLSLVDLNANDSPVEVATANVAWYRFTNELVLFEHAWFQHRFCPEGSPNCGLMPSAKLSKQVMLAAFSHFYFGSHTSASMAQREKRRCLNPRIKFIVIRQVYKRHDQLNDQRTLQNASGLTGMILARNKHLQYFVVCTFPFHLWCEMIIYRQTCSTLRAPHQMFEVSLVQQMGLSGRKLQCLRPEQVPGWSCGTKVWDSQLTSPSHAKTTQVGCRRMSTWLTQCEIYLYIYTNKVYIYTYSITVKHFWPCS